MTNCQRLDGVNLWTDPAPDRSAAIVIFKPGNLDPRTLGDALAKNERIVVTTRAANWIESWTSRIAALLQHDGRHRPLRRAIGKYVKNGRSLG